MKTPLSLFLMWLSLWTLAADPLPPHTMDQSLAFGPLLFGASPEQLQKSGVELRMASRSPDERMELWTLTAPATLGIAAAEARLTFVDQKLCLVELETRDPAVAVELEKLALRLRQPQETQASAVFAFGYKPADFREPARMSVISLPMRILLEGWKAEATGKFEMYEQIRR